MIRTSCLIALSAATLLGGCASTGSRSAATAADPLQASGEQPAWRLSVTPPSMVFADEASGTRIEEPNPTGTVPREGTIRGARLTVDVRNRRCALPSGLSFEKTVRVTYGGRSWAGCGGQATRDLVLAGSRWTIVSVNGRPTPLDGPYEAVFDQQQLTVRVGCAQIGARYALSGRLLSAGSATRSGGGATCVESSAEQGVLRALSLPLNLDLIGSDQLILRNEVGAINLVRAGTSPT